ncbi:hypothetical protein [Streptomyces sp. NPDC048295]|uniref:hypothetical protein n=1 Tax=Streptomyces sp. NPDC048295 TaxID=3154617 RepID=UPI00343BF982
MVPPLLLLLLERPPAITLTKPALPCGDEAYRKLLGHTLTCATCRSGAACSTMVELGRAWQKARR